MLTIIHLKVNTRLPLRKVGFWQQEKTKDKAKDKRTKQTNRQIERGNVMTTKETIIYQSLVLFSQNGFEAVSTRMIARASGISDTAIYKHFKSKQEILDTIIEICKGLFLEKRNQIDINNMDWTKVEDICLDMFKFQTQDEWIVMFRRLLLIEQFKNPALSSLYKNFFINTALDSMTEIFKPLIEAGYIENRDPRVLAMELYAPFFMYHMSGDDSETLLTELREHVSYFRANYRTKKCEEVAYGLSNYEQESST